VEFKTAAVVSCWLSVAVIASISMCLVIQLAISCLEFSCQLDCLFW
jgi:hypothetical protein